LKATRNTLPQADTNPSAIGSNSICRRRTPTKKTFAGVLSIPFPHYTKQNLCQVSLNAWWTWLKVFSITILAPTSGFTIISQLHYWLLASGFPSVMFFSPGSNR